MKTASRVKEITLMAVLVAMGYASLYIIRFPLIPSASFLRFDIKDVFIAIGGLILGPKAAFLGGVVVSSIQILTVSEYTNKKTLYVKVSSFFSIDANSLQLRGDLWFKRNKCQVVEDIYILHNEWVEKRKAEQYEKKRKERQAAQKKMAVKRKAREKQKKLEEQYKGPYEIGSKKTKWDK